MGSSEEGDKVPQAQKDVDTSHPTSGIVFMFTSGAISWRTKRQTTMVLSSTEVEYMAAALAAIGLVAQKCLKRPRCNLSVAYKNVL